MEQRTLGVLLGRLAPYWATVFTSLWMLGSLYTWTAEKSHELYDHTVVEPVSLVMTQGMFWILVVACLLLRLNQSRTTNMVNNYISIANRCFTT